MYNTIVVNHENMNNHLVKLAQTKEEIIRSFDIHVTVPRLAMDMLYKEWSPKGIALGIVRVIKRGNSTPTLTDVSKQYYKGEDLEDHSPVMFIPTNPHLHALAEIIVNMFFIEGSTAEIHVCDIDVNSTKQQLGRTECVQLLTELLMVYSLKHKEHLGICPLYSIPETPAFLRNIEAEVIDDDIKYIKIPLGKYELGLTLRHHKL